MGFSSESGGNIKIDGQELSFAGVDAEKVQKLFDLLNGETYPANYGFELDNLVFHTPNYTCDVVSKLPVADVNPTVTVTLNDASCSVQ